MVYWNIERTLLQREVCVCVCVFLVMLVMVKFFIGKWIKVYGVFLGLSPSAMQFDIQSWKCERERRRRMEREEEEWKEKEEKNAKNENKSSSIRVTIITILQYIHNWRSIELNAKA